MTREGERLPQIDSRSAVPVLAEQMSPEPAAGASLASVEPAFGHAALKGLCPRCGGSGLFAGWLRFAAKCRHCALDFGTFNVGDGPAAFLTLIVGGVIVALAITLQLTVEPPLLVHALLWIPLATIGVILGLRVAKGALLWSEFRQKAREATLPPPAKGEGN